VISSPNHLARRPRPSPLVPHRQTSLRRSGLSAAGNHATIDAPHTVTAASEFVPRPHSQAGLGRVLSDRAALTVGPGQQSWTNPHYGREPNVMPGTV
jgi:hypothetical protein